MAAPNNPNTPWRNWGKHCTTSTRKAARAKGESRYYTGKPCRHGHLGLRLTSTGACVSCSQEHARRRKIRSENTPT